MWVPELQRGSLITATAGLEEAIQTKVWSALIDEAETGPGLTKPPLPSEQFKRRLGGSRLIPVLLFTIGGFLTMGYHPGAEDDTVYLAAVKSAVNPSLYPFDRPFFMSQMRTSFFHVWMAHLIHATGISVGSAELLGQLVSLMLIFYASYSILSKLFEETSSRWGGMALLSAALTLPVAGTALYLADQYLHPRNQATALILCAVARILAGRKWQAIPLLVLSFLLHPLMGSMGISFCCVLTLTHSEPVRQQISLWRLRLFTELSPAHRFSITGLIPFGWVFDKPSQPFLDAINARHCYHLFQWTWYEWLGVIGPLIIFWAVARFARKRQQFRLAQFATAVLLYCVFHLAIALLILSPTRFPALCTLEPMRFLQLVYIFLVLVLGAYLGKYLLRARLIRWALFIVIANGTMFLTQRHLFAATEHIELPGQPSQNPWLQAFAWIRTNTPQDAYFAIDPEYMAAPEEDNDGFRALAERSALADADKDAAVVTKAQDLSPRWQRELHAEAGWKHFQLSDFERLKQEFGVNWVLVSYPQPNGLNCPWHNALLAVCQVP